MRGEELGGLRSRFRWPPAVACRPRPPCDAGGPACKATASPIPRILGYPSPEGELGVLLGELAYGTCVVGGPMATAECGAFGKGLVPGSADEHEGVAAATGPSSDPRPVGRFRRLFVDERTGTMFWTPYATRREEAWQFFLSDQDRRSRTDPRAARRAVQWGGGVAGSRTAGQRHRREDPLR